MWDVGVSKNRGTPKWMVYNGSNPIKMDDLGGKPPLFLETPMCFPFRIVVSKDHGFLMRSPRVTMLEPDVFFSKASPKSWKSWLTNLHGLGTHRNDIGMMFCWRLFLYKSLLLVLFYRFLPQPRFSLLLNHTREVAILPWLWHCFHSKNKNLIIPACTRNAAEV